MNKFFSALLLVGFMVVGVVLVAFAADKIEPQEAAKKIAAGALVVDVRSAEEFSSGHVAGAKNIPHDQIEKRIAELSAYKDKEVVLYCRSGRRSGLALEVLNQNGFKSAFNAGGLSDLQSAGIKVGD